MDEFYDTGKAGKFRSRAQENWNSPTEMQAEALESLAQERAANVNAGLQLSNIVKVGRNILLNARPVLRLHPRMTGVPP